LARNAFIWSPEQAYTTGVRLASVSLLHERKPWVGYSPAFGQAGFLMMQPVPTSGVMVNVGASVRAMN
jgi:hypothetical protein